MIDMLRSIWSDGELASEGDFLSDGANAPPNAMAANYSFQAHDIPLEIPPEIPPPQQQQATAAGNSDLVTLQHFALSFPHLTHPDHVGPFGGYEDIDDNPNTIKDGNHMPPSFIRIPLCVVDKDVADKFSLPSAKTNKQKLPPGSGAQVRFPPVFSFTIPCHEYTNSRCQRAVSICLYLSQKHFRHAKHSLPQ